MAAFEDEHPISERRLGVGPWVGGGARTRRLQAEAGRLRRRLQRTLLAIMGELGYSFSLTTFSPSGKLLQIEHALKAVQSGKTSLGIQGACTLLREAAPRSAAAATLQ